MFLIFKMQSALCSRNFHRCSFWWVNIHTDRDIDRYTQIMYFEYRIGRLKSFILGLLVFMTCQIMITYYSTVRIPAFKYAVIIFAFEQSWVSWSSSKVPSQRELWVHTIFFFFLSTSSDCTECTTAHLGTPTQERQIISLTQLHVLPLLHVFSYNLTNYLHG